MTIFRISASGRFLNQMADTRRTLGQQHFGEFWAEMNDFLFYLKSYLPNGLDVSLV